MIEKLDLVSRIMNFRLHRIMTFLGKRRNCIDFLSEFLHHGGIQLPTISLIFYFGRILIIIYQRSVIIKASEFYTMFQVRSDASSGEDECCSLNRWYLLTSLHGIRRPNNNNIVNIPNVRYERSHVVVTLPGSLVQNCYIGSAYQ